METQTLINTAAPAENNESIPSLDEMFKAGVHFGHKKSKKHPKMEEYILTIRNDVHIFNLEKSLQKLKEAVEAIGKIVSAGGAVMFVGAKTGRAKVTKEAAESCAMPYVNKRWLGGTLTNFKTIARRLEMFRDTEKKMKEGGFNHYTKREQLKIKEELRKMEEKFGGIKELKEKPAAVFLLSLCDNTLAAREAKRTGIKVIAIGDTNADPTLADYLIPANDDALSAIKLIAQTVASAINSVKKTIPEKSEKKE